MSHTFSNALYYPTIDIQDLNWLKTALLFWDSISTIVPESLDEPYKHDDTKYLAEIGFLKPIRVNSSDNSVIGIEDDIINLMSSSEFIHSLENMPKNDSKYGLWSSKMSYKVREKMDDYLEEVRFQELHNYDDMRRNYDVMRRRVDEEIQHNGRRYLFYGEKMSYRINEIINDYLDRIDPRRYHNTVSSKIRRDFENKWSQQNRVYYLNDEFTNMYMLLLAEKISENYSLALVTDSIFISNTGNNLRLRNQTTNLVNNNPRRFRAPHLEQGLLLDYIIKGLSIHPETNLKDIVLFKENHRDELGRFKTELANLTKGLESGQSLDALKEDISNKYYNEFTPAFNDFKATLKDSGIKWFTETFLKVSSITTSATSVPMALLGMPVPQALCAGAGISVIASAVSYNIQKREVLRNNPYSYLLSIQNEYGLV